MRINLDSKISQFTNFTRLWLKRAFPPDFGNTTWEWPFPPGFVPPMADPSRAELIFVLESIFATRYLSAAGVVLLLYDHFLTFDQEVEEIWKAKWTLPKILFLALRYLVPAIIITETYQLSGISDYVIDQTFCKAWFCVSSVLGIVTICISNILILLRLWAIWGRNRTLIIWTFLGFMTIQVTAMASLVYFIAMGLPVVVYSDTFRLCGFSSRFHVESLWVPGIAFECVVFLAAFVNGFHRPRSDRESIASALYRDGILYFVLLFFLRLANFLIAILAPLSLIFVGVYFIWCSTTLLVTRFLLNIRRLASEQRFHQDYLDDPDLGPLPIVTRETICHTDSVKPRR